MEFGNGKATTDSFTYALLWLEVNWCALEPFLYQICQQLGINESLGNNADFFNVNI